MAPTDRQMKMICALIKEKAVPEPKWRGMIWDAFMAESRKELSVDEAGAFIDWLQSYQVNSVNQEKGKIHYAAI
jgi:hypothetical protein